MKLKSTMKAMRLLCSCLVLILSGCAGMQTFKMVNGQWIETTKKIKNTADASGQAGDAKPEVKPEHVEAVRVNLSDSAPNPWVFDAAVVGPEPWRVELDGCRGSVGSDPAVIIEVAKAQKDIRIDSDAGLMVVRTPDGKAWCSGQWKSSEWNNKSGSMVVLDQMAAGKWEVHLGRRSGFHKGDVFQLRVEDQTRPLQLDWDTDGVESFVISGTPTTPFLTTLSFPAEPGESNWTFPDVNDDGYSEACATKSWYLRRPVAQLEVVKPSRLHFWMRGSRVGRDRIDIIGPVSDDGRDYGERPLCLEDGVPLTEQVLEPGKYWVLVASVPEETPGFVNFAAHGDEVDPWAHFDPPTTLDAGAMEVALFYPFLDVYLLRDNMWARLVKEAPKRLWLVSNFDMDELSAEPYRTSTDEQLYPPIDEGIGYPMANELLLHLEHGLYLAADGSLFAIKAEYVTPAAIALEWALPPKNPRNPHSSFQEALERAGDDDAELLKAYETAREACDAENGCDRDALAELTTATWHALVESRTQRRRSLLNGRIRQHLSSIFGIR